MMSATDKMKLVVLGATGQTGKLLINQALDEGHQVTAIVRNPAKMVTTHDNLKVVEGNIFDKTSLSETFKDHDAVVSCLGFSRFRQPVTGYTESATAVTTAMRETNISRFVTITAWYSDRVSGAKSGFLVKWFLVPFLRPVLTNMHEMEIYLETSCSDLNYTVVRPPGLTNGPKTDNPVDVEEDYLVERTSQYQMSRADVAAFMLGCLKNNTYDKKMVAIVA